MSKNKSIFNWCLSSEDRLKMIAPNRIKSGEHIEKESPEFWMRAFRELEKKLK